MILVFAPIDASLSRPHPSRAAWIRNDVFFEVESCVRPPGLRCVGTKASGEGDPMMCKAHLFGRQAKFLDSWCEAALAPRQTIGALCQARLGSGSNGPGPCLVGLGASTGV